MQRSIAETTAAVRATTASIRKLIDDLVRARVEADLVRLNEQARRELGAGRGD